jgi:hypothetical protein
VQASHDVVHLKAVLGELDTWLSTVRRRLFSDNQPGSLYCLTKMLPLPRADAWPTHWRRLE